MRCVTVGGAAAAILAKNADEMVTAASRLNVWVFMGLSPVFEGFGWRGLVCAILGERRRRQMTFIALD